MLLVEITFAQLIEEQMFRYKQHIYNDGNGQARE
jgi:hypothetical protein